MNERPWKLRLNCDTGESEPRSFRYRWTRRRFAWNLWTQGYYQALRSLFGVRIETRDPGGEWKVWKP